MCARHQYFQWKNFYFFMVLVYIFDNFYFWQFLLLVYCCILSMLQYGLHCQTFGNERRTFQRWWLVLTKEFYWIFKFSDRECQREVKLFVKTYLKADGMFAIRMLSTYSGVIFGTDLVRALWTSYHGIEATRRCKSETDLTKVGIEQSVNKFDNWKLRKESLAYSLQGYEDRKLLPPPSPPSELMRVLMEKGTDTSESTPVHGQSNPTTFYLANNFDEKGVSDVRMLCRVSFSIFYINYLIF